MGYKEVLLQRKQAEAANTVSEENENLPEDNNLWEISKNLKFFGVENIRNAPPCIDLRLKDGNYKGLPYFLIVDINYIISEGIELITANKKITITGRNLQLLYKYLLTYRVGYIQANIGNDLCEDKELFVKDIKIEEV